MIFVTIGTQLPFDRLIRALDEMAGDVGDDIFAQVGEGTYEPSNFQWCRYLTPQDFNAKVSSSKIIVSHAGIGSVLSAQRWGKPILIFPRLLSHAEHRNDHQLATLRALRGRKGIYACESIEELKETLREGNFSLPSPVGVSPTNAELKNNLQNLFRNLAK